MALVDPIPVVLFAYARPQHLSRVLESLRANAVPRILAFADGSKGSSDASNVADVRAMLRRVDWAEVALVEHPRNLGLGENVLAGVTEVASRHDAFIVWEDDLVALPGTYLWMSAALRHYEDEPRVMSVTAWTHPRVTPAGVGRAPYFDGRAECWVWGTWSRAWRGMTDATASEKARRAALRGVAPDAYGSDLPAMARSERRKNIWAVRWLYHHLEHDGLCLRPPASMVEHIGFDATATHASGAEEWANPCLDGSSAVPTHWPTPMEDPECRMLWQNANPPQSRALALLRRATKASAVRLGAARHVAKWAIPRPARRVLRGFFGWRWFDGDFSSWEEARSRCTGYDVAAIVTRVREATMAVRNGHAAYERDGVLFSQPVAEPGLVAALNGVARQAGGHLRVIDFGGALGTTYWRHRQELAHLRELSWDVVEQAGLVEAGRKDMADGPLRFHSTFAGAMGSGPHDVLLVSTALQYLENPDSASAEWIRSGIPWILFNNLPLHAKDPDRIAIQRVPPRIYPASYPVWFFNRSRFLAKFEGAYDLVEEFKSEATWPVGWREYPSTGLLLRKKSA